MTWTVREPRPLIEHDTVVSGPRRNPSYPGDRSSIRVRVLHVSGRSCCNRAGSAWPIIELDDPRVVGPEARATAKCAPPFPGCRVVGFILRICQHHDRCAPRPRPEGNSMRLEVGKDPQAERNNRSQSRNQTIHTATKAVNVSHHHLNSTGMPVTATLMAIVPVDTRSQEGQKGQGEHAGEFPGNGGKLGEDQRGRRKALSSPPTPPTPGATS